MTIIVKQGAASIPDEVNGLVVPERFKQILQELSTKHNLTPGEVEWTLQSMAQESLFSAISETSADWASVKAQLDTVYQWSRAKRKSLLGINIHSALSEAKIFETDTKLMQSFGGQDWAARMTEGKVLDVKIALADINDMIPGGMTNEEARWVLQKGLTNSVNIGNSTKRQLADIVKWSRATGVNLATMNDPGTAETLSGEWVDYQRKADLAKLLSKRNLKTVGLSGKWKAVWIDPEAMAKRDPTVMDVQGGGDGRDHDYEVEQRITGIRMSSSNRVISIRDPNGVPQASLEIGEESNASKLEVLDVAATTVAKPYIKELVKKLKTMGTRVWRGGDSTDISMIDEMEVAAYDEYGMVPTVHMSRVGHIEDADSYKEMLDIAYVDANIGADYYPKRAAQFIAALADYAEQRQELYEFEDARQKFSEQAMEWWNDQEFELISNNTLPPRPDEDADEFNPGGVFDRARYEAAEAAWYRLSEPYEKEFEPNQFNAVAYQAMWSRRKKPENRAFYDAIDKKRKRAQMKKDVADKAVEMRRLVEKGLEQEPSDDLETEDDDDIFASSDWRIVVS